MNAHERHEQELPRLLAQLAEGPRPDYRDSLVEATARTSQRPAWTFPGRWLPMDLTAQRAPAATLPLRPILLLVLLGLLVATVMVIAVGSQRREPAPFGPAANGRLIYVADGAIWSRNADGTDAKVIVDDGVGPAVSRQGTRVAFIRPQAGREVLYVANVDGTDVLPLTLPLFGGSAMEWSPDGSTLAIAHEVGGRTVVSLVRTDGSGMTTLESDIALSAPAWRPGDAGQLLVRGRDGDTTGLYLVDRDGAIVSRLAISSDGVDGGLYDLSEPDWSPDGTRLVYHTLVRHSFTDNPGFRIHVADVDPAGNVTRDTPLAFDPLADDEFAARWLPDGRRIAFIRYVACVDAVYVAEALVGATAALARDSTTGCGYEDRGVDYEIAPDGSVLLTWPLAPGTNEVQAHPLESGASLPAAFTSGDVSWQRVAE